MTVPLDEVYVNPKDPLPTSVLNNRGGLGLSIGSLGKERESSQSYHFRTEGSEGTSSQTVH